MNNPQPIKYYTKQFKFYILIILISTNNAYAQMPKVTDTLQYEIVYSFKLVTDTSNRNKLYQEEVVVGIGKKHAYYKSAKAAIAQKKLEQEQQNFITGNTLNLSGINKYIKSEYYFNLKANTFWRKEHLVGTNYVFKEQLPVIKWNIQNNYKTIGTIKCQLATGYCRGRNYTAWFAVDIPITIGPWKFNGLPGLIVSIEDDKKEVFFSLKEINNLTKEQPVKPFYFDKQHTIITLPEWEKMYNTYQENPQTFTKEILNNMGVSATIAGLENESAAKKKKPNTIELKKD
jgi:GLPGLI family protein